MAKEKRIIVFDLETDPFEFGKKPNAFLSGVFDGTNFLQWWGDDPITPMVEWLSNLREPAIIYAHNGGKFDFFYLPWPISNPKIINGRIAKARLGKHELRDSFCILPFALGKYAKDEIDYDKFRVENRENHKQEIMEYHRTDLLSLFDLVTGFIERFGYSLTVAGTAIKQLIELHPVERKSESHDAKFRPYLFGGRVECFQTGELKGDWKVYDVNSMYPFAMANFNHPIGFEYEFCTAQNVLLNSEAPGFCTVIGESRGAFPVRCKGSPLAFPESSGEFNVTLHELRQAVGLGLFRIRDISAGYLACEYTKFDAFVSKFSLEKENAKKANDKRGEIFAKLMLNSAYGKLAANPENYFDWDFLLNGEHIPDGWEIQEDHGWLIIIKRPSPIRFSSYYDVATGASITGAARSILMRAISNATNPIYCDTDSIICEELNEPLHESRLGAWKLEATATRALIVRKKLYALFDDSGMVKSACKGVRLTDDNFLALHEKGEYTYFRDAPTFNKDGTARFIHRTITKG